MNTLTAKCLKAGLLLSTVTLMSACIEKEKITTIPDAENILITTEGKLLVTGGKSIYQINKTVDHSGNTEFQRIDLFPQENCSFTGIAQHNNWVFTSCQQLKLEWKGWTFKLWQDKQLLAADTSKPSLEFKPVVPVIGNDDPIDTLALPNGLAFSPKGDLLVADYDLFSASGVAKISLDYTNEIPRIAQFEKNWLGPETGLQSANGVRVANNQLYVSDNNKVRRFNFDDTGAIPPLFYNQDGDEISNLPDDTVFYSGNLIIDDIMPYCGGIAVTHFVEGQIVYQANNGEKYASAPLSFEFPSALAHGDGQIFSGNELLVTEKGILQEMNTSIGNQLSVVDLGFDLTDPDTCAAINTLD